MADQESSKTKTENLNVAYLGPEASFSHQAAIEVFQPAGVQQAPGVSLHPLPSFPAIFSAIQNSSSSTSPEHPSRETQYDYALLPIENSTNGSVVQVLDLLSECGLDSTALYPDLEVCAEYYLPVHHCLFVSSSAIPTSQSREGEGPDEEILNAIRTIYTHPQVWGQCARFLTRNFSPKTVERIDVGSTSAAAALVAREPRSATSTGGGLNAAISSSLAGERHGLRGLATNIEDEPGKNTTRFFVVRNKSRLAEAVSSKDAKSNFAALQSDDYGDDRGKKHKSLITFTIPHTKPGALADALAVFKNSGFNLTSIDTRPGKRRNWQYVFFVECEEAAAPSATEGKGNIAGMLEELGRFTESLRYLGSFVDRLPKEGGKGA
jgi:prephenate dehydratase